MIEKHIILGVKLILCMYLWNSDIRTLLIPVFNECGFGYPVSTELLILLINYDNDIMPIITHTLSEYSSLYLVHHTRCQATRQKNLFLVRWFVTIFIGIEPQPLDS